MATEKKRADHWLVEMQLVPSRTKAQELITTGQVFIQAQSLTKSNQLLSKEQAEQLFVRAEGLLQFVSRGGLKLAGALEHLDLKVKSLRALDLGSSTGGFSHCLLQQGVDEVLGLDVGRDQLHPELEKFKNFKNIENINVKEMVNNEVVKQFVAKGLDLVVIDLSFISLIKVLPYIVPCLSKGVKLLALVKPQFELPPKALNKKGVVKDEKEFAALEEQVKKAFSEKAFSVIDYFPSNLRGKDGNQEFFVFAEFN